MDLELQEDVGEKKGKKFFRREFLGRRGEWRKGGEGFGERKRSV